MDFLNRKQWIYFSTFHVMVEVNEFLPTQDCANNSKIHFFSTNNCDRSPLFLAFVFQEAQTAYLWFEATGWPSRAASACPRTRAVCSSSLFRSVPGWTSGTWCEPATNTDNLRTRQLPSGLFRGVTKDSFSTKRNLQRKLKPNLNKSANNWLGCGKFCPFDWLSQLGFAGFEFTLQLTFGAETVWSLQRNVNWKECSIQQWSVQFLNWLLQSRWYFVWDAELYFFLFAFSLKLLSCLFHSWFHEGFSIYFQTWW